MAVWPILLNHLISQLWIQQFSILKLRILPLLSIMCFQLQVILLINLIYVFPTVIFIIIMQLMALEG